MQHLVQVKASKGDKNSKYDIPILQTRVDSCRVSQGVMSSLFIKVFLENFNNFSDYEFKWKTKTFQFLRFDTNLSFQDVHSKLVSLGWSTCQSPISCFHHFHVWFFLRVEWTFISKTICWEKYQKSRNWFICTRGSFLDNLSMNEVTFLNLNL